MFKSEENIQQTQVKTPGSSLKLIESATTPQENNVSKRLILTSNSLCFLL